MRIVSSLYPYYFVYFKSTFYSLPKLFRLI